MSQLTNLQIFLICACVYVLIACLFFRAIQRAQPLQTRDGRTEDATEPTPLRIDRRGVARCTPVDADGPPVALKLPPVYSDGDLLTTHKRVLIITGCSDPWMWYSKMIGQEVPYLGLWASEECYKSREPAGYVNIVHFKDAQVIIKEAGK